MEALETVPDEPDATVVVGSGLVAVTVQLGSQFAVAGG
jgi:hypothetical protein